MRYIICFILLQISSYCFSQQEDYKLYHRGIIDAEEAIFVRKDSLEGLRQFKVTFSRYQFAHIDDCLEAFQLALIFKRENDALFFIKKAIDNGFHLSFLELLTTGCPCNYYNNSKKVTIHQHFLAKHRKELDTYSNKTFPKYIKGVDTGLLHKLLERHVKEQFYKDVFRGITANAEAQSQAYHQICNDNLAFIDSLAREKIFLGEKNLGVYCAKLVDKCGGNFFTDTLKRRLLAQYNLPDTYVPVNTDLDYFGINAYYNIYFHNKKSFDILSAYKDEALTTGYLHPREYASLMYNGRTPDTIQLFLRPTKATPLNTERINEARAQFILPSFQCDSLKHIFAHEHDLKLFFGFFNGTR